MDRNRQLEDLIDIDLLQDLQDKLAEITDLEFNIVDFRGNPINNYSNFCDFCSSLRSIEEGLDLCCSANAHGGLESAIRKKPYIFKCPAGLVDIAIPIVIDNQYIGAVFFGQVKTDKEEFSSNKKSKEIIRLFKKYPIIKRKYEDIRYVEYSKLKSIYSVVEIIVNQLINKSDLNRLKEEITFNNIKLKKQEDEISYLKNKLIFSDFKFLQTPLSLNFQLNTLNSISNLALIEDSKKTQEAICTFSDITRYLSKNIGKQVTIEEEVKNINNYLKIQSLRFEDRIKCKINIEDRAKGLKIIPMTLLYFIEYIITHSLSYKKKDGFIVINGKIIENEGVIIIEDNGIGIKENEIFFMLNNSDSNIGDLFNNYYGKEYKIKITSRENLGNIIKIKIPLNK
ncbi:PocR ligand-binding domain-containing protein [Clostridium chauvoei]|uniref:PocR ligand-binding domain-containing protein n=1 Tax=Clostridium chauvoei TaxID=46867 RepID=UPI001C84CFE8|nr:PocR ligand-binding domain-containing protein [Clostridium chauvoei]MBX7422426.1 PocR ligand-binding domain-containing protein [Clostridium chauvoei]